MSFITIAGRSDDVFWWFLVLSEDQERKRKNQNRQNYMYLVALKMSLMSFVYRVLWTLKAFWIWFVSKQNFPEVPWQFFPWLYVHVHSSLLWLFIANPQCAFKVILWRLEVVFWCVDPPERECCTFVKIDDNSFKFMQYLTCSTYMYGFNPSIVLILLYLGLHSSYI